jgi:hypothetical protein
MHKLHASKFALGSIVGMIKEQTRQELKYVFGLWTSKGGYIDPALLMSLGESFHG